jgi:hypothetical protein
LIAAAWFGEGWSAANVLPVGDWTQVTKPNTNGAANSTWNRLQTDFIGRSPFNCYMNRRRHSQRRTQFSAAVSPPAVPSTAEFTEHDLEPGVALLLQCLEPASRVGIGSHSNRRKCIGTAKIVMHQNQQWNKDEDHGGPRP